MPQQNSYLHNIIWFILYTGIGCWSQLYAIKIANATPTSYTIKQNYSNLIEIFGHQVPLPNGTWTLAGIGTDPTSLIQAYGVIATLVLFKLDGNSVTAFILIHTNAIAIDGGWGLSRDCQRQDLPFTKIYEDGEQHAFCVSIRTLTTTVEPDNQDLSAWKDAIKLARRHGWRIPIRWREVGFRISDWHDVLDIRYAFKAQKLLTQIAKPKLESTPESILIKWIDDLSPLVYLGFKRSLIGYPAPIMPGESILPFPNQLVTTTPNTPGWSTSAFSFIKVAINRIFNISTSLGITYLFVGDIYLATGLQVISSTFHSGVNYIEELLWNVYGPQRLRQAKTYDFNYVGKGE